MTKEPTVEEMLEWMEMECVNCNVGPKDSENCKEQEEFDRCPSIVNAIRALIGQPRTVTRDRFDGLINQLMICAFGLGGHGHINSQAGLKMREILIDTFAKLGIEVLP